MVKKAGCDGGFDGLCCRMVIETKRVFDGCKTVSESASLVLVTDSVIPQQANFVSARVVSAELCGYTVTDGENGRCRVSGDVNTRFAVTYEYGGTCYTVSATHIERISVLLRLPESALVPYAIEVRSLMTTTSGAMIGTNSVSVSGCMLRIIKVTAPVDILVPTYGYCVYPPCVGCPCDGLDDVRIFPTFADD